ncbi:hypothetical protein INT43_003396 [Umbelopsis isabellina]|uniref:Uncharacterized protein n=1 Tax=Mortierella isabellina TaxID=91625 RepID=A0A8H7PQ66_MORIS|nr:hypothetical protein INT43_003396 [Umbelopsis isabellina]
MVSAQEVLDTQIATVFITFLFWVFTLVPTRIAQRRSGYDNNNPRQGNDKLDGWGLRAYNSNLNALEALVFITAAECMNIFGARKDEGVGAATMAFSIIFIVCRAVNPPIDPSHHVPF